MVNNGLNNGGEWEEELIVSEYPRPSSPWEHSVASFVEFKGYDYDAYISLNSPCLPNSPLWDLGSEEDIHNHISSLPQLSCGTGDLIPTSLCNVSKLGLTVSESNQNVVADLLFQIDAFIWNLTFNSPNTSPNFTYQIQSNLVSIDLTEAMLCEYQRTTNKATDKGGLSVGKYSGMLCSEKNLESCECVSDSQVVPVPVPGRGEVCFSICCGKTKLAYLSAKMLIMKECVAQSVIVDLGYTDHPLSSLISQTNQRIKSLGKRGRADNTFASEDLRTHFTAKFGGIPQGSFLHETPMQHISDSVQEGPEFVQEDYSFKKSSPQQSEQLAKDAVPSMNHTFPPVGTRQEKAGRGIKKQTDNNTKCDSFERLTPKRKICRSDIEQFFGNSTRLNAAISLKVCESTVKRLCKDEKISRWPPVLKGTKTGASVQSSLAMSSRHVQDAPPAQLPTVTVAKTSPPEKRILDANFVTIKARYDGTDTMIKFDLVSSAMMDDLEWEVAKRLKLNVGSFTIKYEDQEGDRIAVTCSEDLNYCIVKLGSLATIKMLVQSTMRGPT